jgi:hypothetical protein
VARAADNATVPVSPPSAFTLNVEAMVPAFGGASQGLGVIDDGTGNNRAPLRLIGAVVGAASVTSGAATAQPSVGVASSANTVIKGAEVSNGSASTLTVIANGGTAVTQPGAQPTGLTTLRLAVERGVESMASLNGWVRRVRYFARPLLNSELIAVTRMTHLRASSLASRPCGCWAWPSCRWRNAR